MPARKPTKTDPVPTRVKRTGRAGKRGSALAKGVIDQDLPTTNPGAMTMYGRQPKRPLSVKMDAGEDDPRTPPVRLNAPKPRPHYRSK
jgi:hypothetical protein